MSGNRNMFGAAVLLIVASGPAARAGMLFNDQNFSDANWMLISQGTGGGGSASAQSQMSGGNPGSYRQATVTVNSHSGSGYALEIAAHLNQGAVYNPQSSGAIFGLQLTQDAILGAGGFGNGLGEGLALEQNGTVYYSENTLGVGLFTTPNFTWTPHTLSGLVAADFFTADRWLNSTSGPTPDFSASGVPITLGYYTDSVTAGGGYTMTGGVDNWSVAVQPVPEPATLSLLVPFSALALRRQRRVVGSNS